MSARIHGLQSWYARVLVALIAAFAMVMSTLHGSPVFATTATQDAATSATDPGEEINEAAEPQSLSDNTASTPTTTSDVDRTVVNCHAEYGRMNCGRAKLQEIIDTTDGPLTLILPSGRVGLISPIMIRNGDDVELLPYPNDDINPDRSEFTHASAVSSLDWLIVVEEGGKLTLGENQGKSIRIRPREISKDLPTTYRETPNNGLIKVEGELVMNQGEVTGANGMTASGIGAVTVTGPKAHFELNGGKVTSNSRKTDNPGAYQNGAANVLVNKGGTMVMNGGEVSNGRTASSRRAVSDPKKMIHGYGEASCIGIYDSSSFEMNGGVIANNSGFSGGLLMWSSNSDKAKRASAVINDGLIHGNTSTFGGGGLSIFGNAEAVMNGGTISGNHAPNGGGVNAMDLWVTGVDEFWMEIPGEGMSSGMTTEEWSDVSPGGFVMNGGKITNNTSTRTGGGVNVASNSVLLRGGLIDGNVTEGQGGGVYVASKSYELQLENVVVHKNIATYIGGGVWLCPTGSLDLYITEGGAIFENTASTYGADIAHDYLGSQAAYNSYFAQRMLGFGDIAYYKDGGSQYWNGEKLVYPPRYNEDNPGKEQIFNGTGEGDFPEFEDYYASLRSSGVKSGPQITYGENTPDADQVATWNASKERSKAWSKLNITNNRAYRGGGIGSNGGVDIGYEKIDIDLEKDWQGEDGGEVKDLTFFGEDVSANWTDNNGDPIVVSMLPPSFTVQLTATYLDEEGKSVTINAGDPVTVFPREVDGEVVWGHTFKDLPEKLNGSIVAYDLIEIETYGFTPTVSMSKKPDVEGVFPGYVFHLVNTQDPVDLQLEEIWTNPDGTEVDEQLRPEKIEVQLTAIYVDEEGEEQTANVGQPVTITAEADWVHVWEDLPRYINGEIVVYDILETEIDEYKSDYIFTEVTFDDDSTGYGIELTNTSNPITIDVTKSWDDGLGEQLTEDHPESVSVQLMADYATSEGEQTMKVGEPVELNAQNEWSHTWENLPKVLNGELVSYWLEEATVPGFTPRVTMSERWNGYTFDLVNVRDLVDIDLVKTWVDGDGESIDPAVMPEFITVELVGSYTDDEGVEHTLELDGRTEVRPNEDGQWLHTWTDLPSHVEGYVVAYDVDEVQIPGFTSVLSMSRTDDGYAFELINIHEVTSLDVVKTWNGTREDLPEAIEVSLIMTTEDGEQQNVGEPVQITAEIEWAYTFENLPTVIDGEPVTYSVSEAEVPGYTSTIQTHDDYVEIVNTPEDETTELNIYKVWEDAEGNELIEDLPESITILVLAVTASGETRIGEPIDLTAGGNWMATLTGLPVEMNGEPITYTAREAEVDGYTSEVSSTESDTQWSITVTNTKVEDTPPPEDEPETTSVTGLKQWVGGTDHPAIELQLFADGIATGDPVELDGVADELETNPWTVTWSDLPVLGADGETIVYTVDEVNVPQGYVKSIEGLTVTNTYTPPDTPPPGDEPETTSITGIKNWVGGTDHPAIELQLFADGIATGDPVELDGVADELETNPWTVTWSDPPVLGAEDEPITYTVDEVDVPEGYEKSIEGLTVTNTFIPPEDEPETTCVTGVKQWVGGTDHPAIELQLFADGSPIGDPVVLDGVVDAVETSPWTVTWTDLPVLNADGENIVYTVDEVNVPEGYKKTIDGLTVTNTFTPPDVPPPGDEPETTSVTGVKQWVGGTDHPAIELQLFADGSPSGDPVVLDGVVDELETNPWTVTWTDLPVLNADGENIVYTIDEVNVPEGYVKTIDGLTVTNTFTPPEDEPSEEPPLPPGDTPPATPEKPSQPLARTGANIGILALLGAMLLASGVMVRRRYS